MNSKTKTTLIVVAAIIAVIAILVFSCFGTKNKAIDLEEQINGAKSDINVQEKRRADLIPNLVDCVQAYDEHEYQTLMDVINARNSDGDYSEEDVNEIKTMINAVAEAYPQLQSNQNYQQLMTELATTENLIANYRTNYNNWVKDYSRYVRHFPNNIALSITGYDVINYEYLQYQVSVDAPTNLFG